MSEIEPAEVKKKKKKKKKKSMITSWFWEGSVYYRVSQNRCDHLYYDLFIKEMHPLS